MLIFASLVVVVMVAAVAVAVVRDRPSMGLVVATLPCVIIARAVQAGNSSFGWLLIPIILLSVPLIMNASSENYQPEPEPSSPRREINPEGPLRSVKPMIFDNTLLLLVVFLVGTVSIGIAVASAPVSLKVLVGLAWPASFFLVVYRINSRNGK